MFRIDREMRIPTLNALFGVPQSLETYPIVEIVLNVPIWLVHVCSGGAGQAGGEEDATPRWRRFLFQDIYMALEVVAQDQWSAARLYVLLPDHQTNDGEMALERCLEICECTDRNDGNPCWKITTPNRTLIDSGMGTTVDQVTQGEVIWSGARDSGCRGGD